MSVRSAVRPDLQFIPVSALCGDNVVTRSTHMPWYHGPTLLEHLETVPLVLENLNVGMRLPVNTSSGPTRISAPRRPTGVGSHRPGDPVVVLPSGRTTRVRSIVTREGELAERSHRCR
ncbi:MAG: hypothetical protein WDO73_32870 [Ignavibacteriota bacterium]